MVNQVTQVNPVLGLCYFNLRKVAAPFWTDWLITITLTQQTSLALQYE